MRCVCQEDWERMGFHGALQGTGQLADSPQQHGATAAADQAGEGELNAPALPAPKRNR